MEKANDTRRITGERASPLKRKRVGFQAQGFFPGREGALNGRNGDTADSRNKSCLPALRLPSGETKDYDFAVAPL